MATENKMIQYNDEELSAILSEADAGLLTTAKELSSGYSYCVNHAATCTMDFDPRYRRLPGWCFETEEAFEKLSKAPKSAEAMLRFLRKVGQVK